MVMRSERVNRAFHALSDPTRRRILEQLSRNDRTVMELASQFTISQPAVSKHLRVLEEAGLISRRKSGRQRFCRVQPAGLRSAADWMATWSAYWDLRLDGLQQVLAKYHHPGGQP